LVFYLCNKSPTVEHQFAICRLSEFVYCVCTFLYGHDFTMAGGSQSTGIVEQGANITTPRYVL